MKKFYKISWACVSPTSVCCDEYYTEMALAEERMSEIIKYASVIGAQFSQKPTISELEFCA